MANVDDASSFRSTIVISLPLAGWQGVEHLPLQVGRDIVVEACSSSVGRNSWVIGTRLVKRDVLESPACVASACRPARAAVAAGHCGVLRRCRGRTARGTRQRRRRRGDR